MDIKLHQIEYHRNGISGEGFHAILFSDPDHEGADLPFNMLATVFEERGHVSVVNVPNIATHGVTFGFNSFRGDHYEPVLREWISDRRKALNAKYSKTLSTLVGA